MALAVNANRGEIMVNSHLIEVQQCRSSTMKIIHLPATNAFWQLMDQAADYELDVTNLDISKFRAIQRRAIG
jgi:hypothetical protein